MVILETALLLTAILVGVGSALFLRSAVQKNQNAEKKYRQEREARDSAEGALRRAEDERRESESELEQARDALQAAEEMRRRAQEEIAAMARAKEQAERERDAANERTQLAEAERDVARRERDEAIEQARLANERAQRAEDARDAAIKGRDDARAERDVAIKERDDARAERDAAIKAKCAAEEETRSAKEAQSKAEKERDEAIEKARLANELAQRAEELQKQAEDACDAAMKERDHAQKELRYVVKALERAQKRQGNWTSPVDRNPKRSKDKQPKVEGVPRGPKPEIVCQNRHYEWVLGIALPENFLSDDAEPQVAQDNSPLEELDNLWQLRDLRGTVSVRSGERSWEVKLGERAEDYLLFKLSGYDLRHGTRVRSINKGAYLVVVPEAWERKDSDLGSEPEAVSTGGYLAYYYVVDQSHSITFRTPDGTSVEIAQGTTQFDLTGNRLPDSDEESGLVFGDTLPRIRAANPNVWQQVKTIVVGEEGRERKPWKSKAISPVANKTEQELPPEILDWQASWFFVRFYDEDDQLVESTDFRLARGLSDIQVNQPPLLPAENGHSATSVEFHHKADCKIEPPSGLKTTPSDGMTIVEIPPDAALDKTVWKIAAQGHESIQITILVERIWWVVGTKEKPPLDSEWVDKPLALTRADFAANSDMVLWIRLPKPRWTNEVHVGFSQETARAFPVKVTEQTVFIPLCDFCDSTSLRQPGLSRFVIDNSNTTLARVRVEAQCKRCDGFVSMSSYETLQHIESSHLHDFFRPLTYDELRERIRHLPPRILKCRYCPFYVGSDEYGNPTDKMYEHLKECPQAPRIGGIGPREKGIVPITDLDEIRENAINNLPDIQRCKLESCAWEKENPSNADLLRHLKENHLNALYELR